MPPQARKTTAAKPTASHQASSVASFKKRPDPIELPSGNYMVLSHQSLAMFVQTGQIPNSLMSVITGAVNSKKSKGKLNEEQTMDLITENPKALEDMFKVVDKFVCAVAIEPRVYPVPTGKEVRDDELLYVDELDQADKMFIFQRGIGGTTDLESFRRELAAGVDLVQQRENVEQPAKRAPRRK